MVFIRWQGVLAQKINEERSMYLLSDCYSLIRINHKLECMAPVLKKIAGGNTLLHKQESTSQTFVSNHAGVFVTVPAICCID